MGDKDGGPGGAKTVGALLMVCDDVERREGPTMEAIGDGGEVDAK